jgi:hypothetical protein
MGTEQNRTEQNSFIALFSFVKGIYHHFDDIFTIFSRRLTFYNINLRQTAISKRG